MLLKLPKLLIVVCLLWGICIDIIETENTNGHFAVLIERGRIRKARCAQTRWQIIAGIVSDKICVSDEINIVSLGASGLWSIGGRSIGFYMGLELLGNTMRIMYSRLLCNQI